MKTPSENEIKFGWEGRLSPKSEIDTERLLKEVSERGIKAPKKINTKDLPIVSIGEPETWYLPDIYSSDAMPKALISKLKEVDIYFIRLVCSLRPRHNELIISSARFSLSLWIKSINGTQPIVLDLHPREVTQTIEKQVKVTIGPTIKFSAVEASIGDISFGFEYQELKPRIYATGIGESNPSWDYSEIKGYPLYGSKFMHLILRVPKGERPIYANATLVGTLKYHTSIIDSVLSISENDIVSDLVTMELVK